MVVATGGGAIVDPDNYASMAASGVIVCLDATPETIVARLSASPENGDDAPEERPLLAGPDPIGRVRDLKAERQGHYDMAAFSVNTDGLSVDEVAREVVRLFRERTEPDHD